MIASGLHARSMIKRPSDSLSDSANDVGRTDMDAGRRLCRCQVFFAGASVRMAWKRSDCRWSSVVVALRPAAPNLR